eukprot:2483264-Rhodomonas_salina.1
MLTNVWDKELRKQLVAEMQFLKPKLKGISPRLVSWAIIPVCGGTTLTAASCCRARISLPVPDPNIRRLFFR